MAGCPRCDGQASPGAVTVEEAEHAGWTLARDSGTFSDQAGPFWSRRDGDTWQYAVLTDSRHSNNRGVVHGGLLLTFADHALGLTVWEHVGRAPCATIQLNMQFVDAVQPGDFVELEVTIVRATRSVVFVRGSLAVAERPVAIVDGVWKILSARA